MDIFKKISNEQTMDFNLFKAKKVQKEQNSSNIIYKNNSNVRSLEEKPSDKIEIKNEVNTTQKIVCKTNEEINANSNVINFKKAENKNEQAVSKLERELETAKTNLLPVFPIVRYLKNKCISDSNFADLVNNEKKTLEKCFKYVIDEVKKALNSQNGWLDDNEVYAYAETYYYTSEEVFEKLEADKKAKEMKRQEEVAKKRKEQEEKRKQVIDKNNEDKPISNKSLEVNETQISLI